MMEVERKPVSELCELIVDCVNRTAPIVERETPYKMIRTTNVRDGRINLEGARNVTEETFERWTRRAKVLDGDVLLTREAPIGEVGYVNGLGHVFLGQRIMQYRPDPTLINPRYFFYAFRSKDLQHQFGSHDGSGSVVSHIRVGDCHKFEMSVPDRPTQDSIVDLLGALDDKIELNRRMNETLEQMARALYRDWFVDFGPTRRQMEGATDPAAMMGHAFPPEKATTLAPLFPAKLGDDGLPEGWSRSDVGSEFDVVMGQSPPGDTYNETGDGLPFFQGRRDFGFRFPNRRVYCTDPKRISGRDWTLLSVRAPVGDINRAAEKCAIGRGVGAFLHKAGLHSFTYYNGLAFQTELQSYDKDGTVFGAINQKQFKGLQVVVPDQGLAAQFDELVTPMDKKIRLNTEENQTLAEMRDVLLPKLMSGEIRLKDAEGAV